MKNHLLAATPVSLFTLDHARVADLMTAIYARRPISIDPVADAPALAAAALATFLKQLEADLKSKGYSISDDGCSIALALLEMTGLIESVNHRSKAADESSKVSTELSPTVNGDADSKSYRDQIQEMVPGVYGGTKVEVFCGGNGKFFASPVDECAKQ